MGGQPIGPHKRRHSAALGHGSIAKTQAYVDVFQQRVARAVLKEAAQRVEAGDGGELTAENLRI